MILLHLLIPQVGGCHVDGQQTRQRPATGEPAYRPPPRPLRRSSSHDIEHDFTSHADLVTSPGQGRAAAGYSRVSWIGPVQTRLPRGISRTGYGERWSRTGVARLAAGRRWTA